MLDFLTDYRILALLLIFIAAAAAAGLVMLYLAVRRQKQPGETVTPTSEWEPTGKIDFYCAQQPGDEKAPAPFLLRVEDYRTVESISGVEHVEIRWRNATLAEAKAVVVAYQNVAEVAAKGYRFQRAGDEAPRPDAVGRAPIAEIVPTSTERPAAVEGRANIARIK
jgi:hypothetical protein